jgi:uncharacterized protein YhaN
VREAVEEEAARLRIEKLAADRAARRAAFDARYPDFERRREAAEELERLESRYEELTADLDREDLAAELLTDAAEQLTSRVGGHLMRAMGQALERITGGRYSRVNLAPDFRILVYSDEKNAFVDALELSAALTPRSSSPCGSPSPRCCS